MIGAGFGAGAAGPLPGGEHVLAEPVRCGAQRSRDSIQAALAPPGGKPVGLVGGQRKALGGEVVLQSAGQGAHRPAGPAGAVQQVLRMIRVLVLEQPAKLGDHRAGAGWAVPGGQLRDEPVQPARRRGEPGGQASGLDEGPLRAALPARRAQPQPFMPFDLPALRAFPGRIFGLAGPGAGPAPASIFPQISRAAAPRAGPLGCRPAGPCAGSPGTTCPVCGRPGGRTGCRPASTARTGPCHPARPAVSRTPGTPSWPRPR